MDVWTWREFVGCLVVIVIVAAVLLDVSSSALDFGILMVVSETHSQKVPSPNIV